MRFKETQYSIHDISLRVIVPKFIDLDQWIQSGVKIVHIIQDIEVNNRIVHFSGCSLEKKITEDISFNNLYMQIVKFTDDKLAILMSLYNRLDGDEILVITNNMNSTEVLFESLKESNGYLIYHHQFESFLMSEMGFDIIEANELRKSWNKKVKCEKEKVILNENYYKLVGLMPFEVTFNKVH
ncbi:MAG: hypothetical protein RL108_68 [Bacteroidota bacterium]|jgi:hypothetical protein